MTFLPDLHLPRPAQALRATFWCLLLLSYSGGLTAQDYPYGIPRASPKYWKGWEIHAAVSTSIVDYDYWRVSQQYVRSSDSNAPVRFVRDDGSALYATVDRSVGSEPARVGDKLYQIGLNRVTTSGFIWRLSLGYFRHHFLPQNDNFTDLGADDILKYTEAREQAVMGEIGFQYSFFRRHRIRPYIGAAATTFFYYKGETADRFIEGGTGQTGLVERFFSTEYFPLYPDFSLTAGVQYQISKRLAAGAFVWMNSGYDLWLDAPLGIEIRYSLRERPLRAHRNRKQRR